jgi:8-oxo-dGTP diphosphatase
VTPDRKADVVRAAGGVVWRRRGGGVQVLVVHRPKYDDWSLPKGKLDRGETYLRAAVREVREETGLTCEVGPELARSRYTDGKGRPKVVRYWAMQAVKGSFAANDEVDEIRWLPLGRAAKLLSYRRDGLVLDAFDQARRAGWR